MARPHLDARPQPIPRRHNQPALLVDRSAATSERSNTIKGLVFIAAQAPFEPLIIVTAALLLVMISRSLGVDNIHFLELLKRTFALQPLSSSLLVYSLACPLYHAAHTYIPLLPLSLTQCSATWVEREETKS